MKLAFGIQHDWRDPNRRRAKRLDVIEFLFNPLKVSTVNSRGIAGTIRSLGIVIGGIPVVKTIRDDLINILGLPKTVALSAGTASQQCGERKDGKKSFPWSLAIH